MVPSISIRFLKVGIGENMIIFTEHLVVYFCCTLTGKGSEVVTRLLTLSHCSQSSPHSSPPRRPVLPLWCREVLEALNWRIGRLLTRRKTRAGRGWMERKRLRCSRRRGLSRRMRWKGGRA